MHHILRRQTFFIVLCNLIGKENHSIAFGKPSCYTREKLADRQRHRDVAKHVKGYHPVEQHVGLSLVNYLNLASFYYEHGQLAEVGAQKSQTPCSVPFTSVNLSSNPSLGL